MTSIDLDESITNAINNMTDKVSKVLLQEFLQLPKELQINIVLMKSSQLLLANIVCHIAITQAELESIADSQGEEVKELIFNCAFSGFADKFEVKKH